MDFDSFRKQIEEDKKLICFRGDLVVDKRKRWFEFVFEESEKKTIVFTDYGIITEGYVCILDGGNIIRNPFLKK